MGFKDEVPIDTGFKSEVPHQSLFNVNLENDTFGNFSCHVSNSVGDAAPCHILISEDFMEKIATGNYLILIIIIVSVVVGLLLIAALIGGLVYAKSKGKESNKLDDKDTHKNEDLPFDNLKKPPEQVLNPGDELDYADAQFKKG